MEDRSGMVQADLESWMDLGARVIRARVEVLLGQRRDRTMDNFDRTVTPNPGWMVGYRVPYRLCAMGLLPRGGA
jgi:hypothetical protein